MGVAAITRNLAAGPLFHAGAFAALGVTRSGDGILVFLASRARAPAAAGGAL